jgi:hypothetical protein
MIDDRLSDAAAQERLRRPRLRIARRCCLTAPRGSTRAGCSGGCVWDTSLMLRFHRIAAGARREARPGSGLSSVARSRFGWTCCGHHVSRANVARVTLPASSVTRSPMDQRAGEAQRAAPWTPTDDGARHRPHHRLDRRRRLSQVAEAVAQRRGIVPAPVMVGALPKMEPDFQALSQSHGPSRVDLHVVSRRPIDGPER